MPVLKADFPSVNGKSRAEAEASCSAAIDQNPTVLQCVQKAGMNFEKQKDVCVEDFKVLQSDITFVNHISKKLILNIHFCYV